MSLRDKVSKFLQQSTSKKSAVVDLDTPDQDWSEIRDNLPESAKRILDKHAKNIDILQIKEIDLYRMLIKFESIENVLDSHIGVLLERQKTQNEGDWHNVGQIKPQFAERRAMQKSVDAKKIERNKIRVEKSENKKSKILCLIIIKGFAETVQEYQNQQENKVKKEPYVRMKDRIQDNSKSPNRFKNDKTIFPKRQKYEKLKQKDALYQKSEKLQLSPSEVKRYQKLPYIPPKKQKETQQKHQEQSKEIKIINSPQIDSKYIQQDAKIYNKDDKIIQKENNKQEKPQNDVSLEKNKNIQKQNLTQQQQSNQNQQQTPIKQNNQQAQAQKTSHNQDIPQQTTPQKILKAPEQILFSSQLDEKFQQQYQSNKQNQEQIDNQQKIEALEKKYINEIQVIQDKFINTEKQNKSEIKFLHEKIQLLETKIENDKQIQLETNMKNVEFSNKEQQKFHDQLNKLEQEKKQIQINYQQKSQDLQNMIQKFESLQKQYENLKNPKEGQQIGLNAKHLQGQIIYIQQQGGQIPHLLLQQASGVPLLMPVQLTNL